MKDAYDYAKQALRFAERAMVEPEASAIRLAWQDAYEAGLRAARSINASKAMREAHVFATIVHAERAARAARHARKGGWWADEWRDNARWNAMDAASCAGYAAGVAATA